MHFKTPVTNQGKCQVITQVAPWLWQAGMTDCDLFNEIENTKKAARQLQGTVLGPIAHRFKSSVQRGNSNSRSRSSSSSRSSSNKNGTTR